MESFELKDFRAAHFVMSFIRSHVQGWYTRENILSMADHPDADQERLASLGRLMDKVNAWNDAIRPGATPILGDDGTVNRPEKVENVCKVLMWLFDQHAQMNNRLNAILDNPGPLHGRREDMQYIVACMGWVYYAINHAVQGDIHFAEQFDDHELASARAGQLDTSQKELDFVSYLCNSFKDDTLYNPETSADLTAMIETVMNVEMKDSAMRIDKYLTVFGK